MKILINKQYVNRAGEILTCKSYHPNTSYCHLMTDGSGTMRYSVNVEGRFVDRVTSSPRDLMSEYDPDALPVFPEWMKDHECITTDGQIVKLAGFYNGIEFDWTCLPAWANWIAQDEDKGWTWFKDEPVIDTDSGVWIVATTHVWGVGSIPDDYAPSNIIGTWKDNLHKRPSK